MSEGREPLLRKGVPAPPTPLHPPQTFSNKTYFFTIIYRRKTGCGGEVCHKILYLYNTITARICQAVIVKNVIIYILSVVFSPNLRKREVGHREALERIVSAAHDEVYLLLGEKRLGDLELEAVFSKVLADLNGLRRGVCFLVEDENTQRAALRRLRPEAELIFSRAELVELVGNDPRTST